MSRFPQFHGPNGTGLAGAIMTSGIYDLTASKMSDGGQRLFRRRPARAMPSAPRGRGCSRATIPLMVGVAELDPPRFVDQFNADQERCCAERARCVRTVFLPQHSHMSETYAINTKDTRLTDQILEFVKTGR